MLIAIALATIQSGFSIPATSTVFYLRSANLYRSKGDGSEERLLAKGVSWPSYDERTGYVSYFEGEHLRVLDTKNMKQKKLDVEPVKEHRGGPQLHPKYGFLTFDRTDTYELTRKGTRENAPLKLSKVYYCMVEDSGAEELIYDDDFKTFYEDDVRSYGGFSWAPDGERFAFCKAGDVWIGNAEFDEMEMPNGYFRMSWGGSRTLDTGGLEGHSGAINESGEAAYTTWSKDGSMLAVQILSPHAGYDYIEVFSTSDWKSLFTLSGNDGFLWGDWVILTGDDGSQRACSVAQIKAMTDEARRSYDGAPLNFDRGSVVYIRD